MINTHLLRNLPCKDYTGSTLPLLWCLVHTADTDKIRLSCHVLSVSAVSTDQDCWRQKISKLFLEMWWGLLICHELFSHHRQDKTSPCRLCELGLTLREMKTHSLNRIKTANKVARAEWWCLLAGLSVHLAVIPYYVSVMLTFQVCYDVKLVTRLNY